MQFQFSSKSSNVLTNPTNEKPKVDGKVVRASERRKTHSKSKQEEGSERHKGLRKTF
jgi:ribosomal protein L21